MFNQNQPNKAAEKALKSILKKQNADGGLLITIKPDSSGMSLIVPEGAELHTAAILTHLTSVMMHDKSEAEFVLFEALVEQLGQTDTEITRMESAHD